MIVEWLSLSFSCIIVERSGFIVLLLLLAALDDVVY
jgi:hypothetical protein